MHHSLCSWLQESCERPCNGPTNQLTQLAGQPANQLTKQSDNHSAIRSTYPSTDSLSNKTNSPTDIHCQPTHAPLQPTTMVMTTWLKIWVKTMKEHENIRQMDRPILSYPGTINKPSSTHTHIPYGGRLQSQVPAKLENRFMQCTFLRERHRN